MGPRCGAMNGADDILAHADAELGRAHALCAQLDSHIGLSRAICRQAKRRATLQSELCPAIAIALLVREQSQDMNS